MIMASVNKVILIGNLGRDPEVRYIPNGDAIANLNIATTEKWKDKGGEMQEHTEWHRVSFFGRQAEVCGEYLKKGSSVYVEGSIRTRKYTDKEGVERYATEIKGTSMQMLGGKSTQSDSTDSADVRKDEQRAPRERPAQQSIPLPWGIEQLSDDIPF